MAAAHPQPDSGDTLGLLGRVEAGDAAAAGELLARHRPALVAFVGGRLDPAVRTRVDASDVAQEALAEMARRLPDFLERRPMPFHLWARKTAYERLLKIRRAHRADCRDVGREEGGLAPSAVALARSLAAPEPTASEAAEAREVADQVAAAVKGLAEADREILVLRHVDGLSHVEAGLLLGVDPAAARQRYGRALFRLQRALRESGVLEKCDE
ncbi:RNA polymerase sigma factor [Urbifossiella limnaea]|uniref:RNA polymerase sigma factor CnrH n=1 Tax=Urbifossiella limnaea TaxID=2528023 RepID=A0A517XPT7_9BACT|nr:sigma-70 family RNA polymerase sigma factor [Urbifossiella limnaea]QDU19531.1 RNA polymerase sigma factor CnrH [Urbifossiella limnaea]